MEVKGEGNLNGINVRYYKLGKLFVGIATNIGPRIMHLSLTGREGDNVFGVVEGFSITTSEGVWKIYGGHRLWLSPEAMPRSYFLDNEPVDIVEKDNEIIILGKPELQNFVRKRIRLKQGSDDYSISVTHEIENVGRWPIKFSCWALSVMAKKGLAIVPIWPHKTDERGLLPDRVLSLWPYTKLNDGRLTFTPQHMFVRQDPSINEPLKIGMSAYPHWVAYHVKGKLFIKSFKRFESEYPDYGVYAEVFTNNEFLELETLGPLREVKPGDVNTHIETWKLVEVSEIKQSDEDVEKIVAPKINYGTN